ncbi:ATP-binding cassette domain-containing protein [Tindallia californiensis]|nr:ATP-binding cassette domain-containing protein [Tindallia californiensis]
MELLRKPLSELLQQEPYLESFFHSHGLSVEDKKENFLAVVNRLRRRELEDLGTSREFLLEGFVAFAEHARSVRNKKTIPVESIKVLGGTHKDGSPETLALEMRPGDMICLVGETGSGKSRLLADIEWMAQKDTPTNREVLINGNKPDSKYRFAVEHKMVAQLSQNMNFVMDLSVKEYIALHAESKMLEDSHELVDKILTKANELSGEPFEEDTCLTALSGGQSRALMVADTALLSQAPVVLIDELENAGIHRRKALELLTGESKIVLMATHDPILALHGHKRLVLKNGGVDQMITTSNEEKALLKQLEYMDKQMMDCRKALRRGEKLKVEKAC